MVNKQYNIHNPKSGKGKTHSPTPSLRIAFPIVSSSPNPMQVATNVNLDPITEEDKSIGGSIYGRNITYYTDESMKSDTLTVKDLSINDIGRFSYVMADEKSGVSGNITVNFFKF